MPWCSQRVTRIGRSRNTDNSFVAKKLIDTGNGRGHVPLPEAVRFLSADLVRLKRMEYFSKAFFTRGEREGAELTYFQVSDGFLIKAYANDPSPEPEERPEDLADFVGKSTLVSVYLVEPRRASSAVLKFSGALGMPHRFDRRSATIMAFSHFVLEEADPIQELMVNMGYLPHRNPRKELTSGLRSKF
ncbi:hypothetical protein V8E52_008561 [Russula decolorans]